MIPRNWAPGKTLSTPPADSLKFLRTQTLISATTVQRMMISYFLTICDICVITDSITAKTPQAPLKLA